ncbi:glycyl radical protein [Chloroflexota bacterium]
MIEKMKESTTAGFTRGQRLWARQRDELDKGELSLERARLLTASYKETEGLPVTIRRAKAFEKIVTGIPIYIEEEQLLAGDFASKPMWAEWYPELAVSYVKDEIDTGEESFAVIQKELAEQREISDYWNLRSLEGSFLVTHSEEERKRFEELNEAGSGIIRLAGKLDRPGGYHVVNYEKVIVKGFRGIIMEVEEELRATIIRDDQSFNKVNILKAMVITYEAAIKYAHRYAALARELAETAGGKRKSELEKIAEICQRVPENPARTFQEALQAMWFNHVLIYLEIRPAGESPGRVDQYLYPYYRQDVAEGRLTKEETIELLECLRVKMGGLRHFSTKLWLKNTSGEAQFHNVTIGGQLADGTDATNELSYLILEAAFRTRSPHHTISIRWHEHLPHEFLLRALELVKLGLGYPAFFNDDSNIPAVMEMGASLEEARGYAIGGCVVPQIPGKAGCTPPLAFNTPKALELALNNGLDPLSGKQIGEKTGKFEEFETFEELLEAFLAQFRHFSLEGADIANRQRAFREAMVPPVYQSGLVDDCIKSGTSVLGAGPRYHYQYHNACGMMDTVDSLAAVKKCVFEDGSISKQGLLDALAENFEGKEEIRELLLAAPKYGNDDDYTDSIASDLFSRWRGMVTEELDALYGHKFLACAYSASLHYPFGQSVGALPCGRLAGQSLADGSVSPCQGVDFKGPTAVLNSATKIDQYPLLATLLNMKFQPSTLSTAADLETVIALIKTYFQGGGKHIQFNVVDQEILLDAKAHPENHRNLLIRVAGYSALFITLDSEVQDEIIRRTVHAL